MRSTTMGQWRKSSRSQSGNCVETRVAGDRREIRDSKDPDGPVLSFSREAFAELLDDLKAGKFAG